MRANGWVGKRIYILHDLPSRNYPSRKSLDFEFFEPILHDKKAQENASFPYATLRVALQNFSHSDPSFVRATLYDQIRTFFKSE